MAILVYDVKEERVRKIHAICSKYLFWKQNSVFIGKINKSRLEMLEDELRKNTNPLEDYIIFFLFPSNVKFRVKEIGCGRYEKILW